MRTIDDLYDLQQTTAGERARATHAPRLARASPRTQIAQRRSRALRCPPIVIAVVVIGVDDGSGNDPVEVFEDMEYADRKSFLDAFFKKDGHIRNYVKSLICKARTEKINYYLKQYAREKMPRLVPFTGDAQADVRNVALPCPAVILPGLDPASPWPRPRQGAAYENSKKRWGRRKHGRGRRLRRRQRPGGRADHELPTRCDRRRCRACTARRPPPRRRRRVVDSGTRDDLRLYVSRPIVRCAMGCASVECVSVCGAAALPYMWHACIDVVVHSVTTRALRGAKNAAHCKDSSLCDESILAA